MALYPNETSKPLHLEGNQHLCAGQAALLLALRCPARHFSTLKPIPCVRAKSLQSCPTLCDPMDLACQALLSMGILQARILEWVAMPSSRRASQSRDQTRSPTLQVDSLPSEPPGKPMNTGVGGLSLLQGIFVTQESDWDRLHFSWILYQMSHQGSP